MNSLIVSVDHFISCFTATSIISVIINETKNNIKPSNSSPPTILKKILKDRQYQVKYADIFVQKGHQSNILSTLFFKLNITDLNNSNPTHVDGTIINVTNDLS